MATAGWHGPCRKTPVVTGTTVQMGATACGSLWTALAAFDPEALTQELSIVWYRTQLPCRLILFSCPVPVARHRVTMTVILYDDGIRSRLDARDAVRWMGEAIDGLCSPRAAFGGR